MNIDRPLDEMVRESRAQRAAERKKNLRSRRRRNVKKQTPAAANGDAANAEPATVTPAGMDIDTPQQKDPLARVSGGIKKKRRSRGSASKKGRMEVEIVKEKPANTTTPAENGQAPAAIASVNTTQVKPVVKKVNKGAKISVSNLDLDVTQSDIAELFETVGPLKSARLNLLPDGHSAGSAEVFFVEMKHALEAIKRYNDVPLDNRPLKITLATDSAPVRITRASRRGDRRKMLVDPRAMDDDDDIDRQPPSRNFAPTRYRDRDFPHDRDFDRDNHLGERRRSGRFVGRRSGPRRGPSQQNYDTRNGPDSGGMYID